jgi:hypothetical protein
LRDQLLHSLTGPPAVSPPGRVVDGREGYPRDALIESGLGLNRKRRLSITWRPAASVSIGAAMSSTVDGAGFSPLVTIT